MTRLVLLLLLVAAPAWSQTRLTPKDSATHASTRNDDCAPIGRTEDGKLVYAMKCQSLPAPPPSSPPAEAREAPATAPEPEVQHGGLFGWSYDRRPRE